MLSGLFYIKTTVKQLLSNLSKYLGHLESLLKYRLLGPTLGVPDSVSLTVAEFKCNDSNGGLFSKKAKVKKQQKKKKKTFSPSHKA